MGKSKAKSKKIAKRMSMLSIKGKGDYEVTRPSTSNSVMSKLDKVLSRLPKGTFAAGGAAIGARMGGAKGASMGRNLGAGLASISGYGDYTVRSNSLGTVSTSVDMVPQFVKNDHSVRVVHREYISDLKVPSNPTEFSNADYLINPANATLFPWLARMAKQYSQYKIHGMVFSYKSMSSEYADAGPLGTVVLATNYNAVDRKFGSKLEMENSEFAVSTKPSQSMIHAIECDPGVTGLSVLYVRDPAYETTDTSDRRFYDYGRFQVATTGLPGMVGSTMGELWVSYDIEFTKPIIGGETVAGSCAAIVGQFDGTSGVVSNGNPTGRIPAIQYTGDAIAPTVSTVYSVMNTVASTSGDLGLDNKVVYNSGQYLFLRQNGNYRILYEIVGGTTSTNFYMSSFSTATSAGTVTNNGAAVHTSFGVLGRVAHACTNAVSNNGYRCVLVQDIVVRGIPTPRSDADYIRVEPPSFTSNGVALCPTLLRFVRVEWLQTGQNGQTTTYLPSA